jgi:hypothetical protein
MLIASSSCWRALSPGRVPSAYLLIAIGEFEHRDCY